MCYYHHAEWTSLTSPWGRCYLWHPIPGTSTQVSTSGQLSSLSAQKCLPPCARAHPASFADFQVMEADAKKSVALADAWYPIPKTTRPSFWSAIITCAPSTSTPFLGCFQGERFHIWIVYNQSKSRLRTLTYNKCIGHIRVYIYIYMYIYIYHIIWMRIRTPVPW